MPLDNGGFSRIDSDMLDRENLWKRIEYLKSKNKQLVALLDKIYQKAESQTIASNTTEEEWVVYEISSELYGELEDFLVSLEEGE